MIKIYTDALKHDIFEMISEVASELNMSSYVIGGFVRDYFLKRNADVVDVDIVTLGSGIDLAKAVSEKIEKKPKVQIFKTYGTAMLKYESLQIEFVGARKESYSPNSRNPIVENGTLQDDQNRRDFTINAIAFSLNKSNYGKLIDPFDGIRDLKNKRIITPLDPNITYSDDPLRMMRAIRFATQLNFEIAPNSLNAISENITRIDIITKERIVEELHKILASPKPSIGFLLLDETGLLNIILPELVNLKGIDEIDGHRHKDNFYHTLQVVDNICKATNNIWLRWTALLHDIGKAPTKKFDKNLGWTFYAHEYISAKMVYTIFKRLKMPLNEHLKFVQKIILMSSRPIVLAEDFATDSAIRRLVFDAGEHIDDLMTLCEADITTKNKAKYKKYHNNFKIVRKKIQEVEARDHIRNFQPPISGDLIMKTFKIKPCKEIGIVKEAIKEAILDGEIPNEYKPAYQFMLKKAKEIGLN